MESTGASDTTPLYPVYSDLSEAKIVPYKGWLLPLHFENGILREHTAVRSSAGLFDVSHMGEISISGPESTLFLDGLCTNDISSLEEGRAVYTPLCREDGGTLDDILIYRTEESSYLMVTNAANTAKVVRWLRERAEAGGINLEIHDMSEEYVLLALQGPKAESIITDLTEEPVKDLSPFAFTSDVRLGGSPCIISRTGYTGEDGFELFTSPSDGPGLWKTLLAAGSDKGLEPCGLGARDTLRLEAGFPLYGHELDESITPVEADLVRFIDFEGADFVGKSALVRQTEGRLERIRRGFRLIDKGMPRQGQRVLAGDEEIGFVTSGSRSPSTGSFIAMGYIDSRYASSGKRVNLDVNGRIKRVEVVDLPFYRRTKHKA